MIRIVFDQRVIEDASSVVVVPQRAIAEPGYIQTLPADGSKHAFHAMAQTVYFQYQDDELQVEEMEGPVQVIAGDHEMVEEQAMIIYRDAADGFAVHIHRGLPVKKMLETAYRFCTRWVRLDI